MSRPRRLVYATTEVRAHQGCACTGCLDPHHQPAPTLTDDPDQDDLADPDEAIDAWAEDWYPETDR